MRLARLSCVLLALLTLQSCGRFQPYPQVVAAVYRVHISYDISGREILSSVPGEIIYPLAGSATAVAGGGHLLTARHVVDIDHSRTLCSGVVIDPSRLIVLEHAKVESVQLTVTGPDGREWRGTARAAPGPACDEYRRLRLVWDPKSTAMIVAVDYKADLALLHIAATDIAYLELDRRMQARGTPVVAAGFATDGMTIREGAVVQGCMMDGLAQVLGLAAPKLRISQPLKPGMSGGPAASGTRLLGINILTQVGPPFDSFAVPAPYAAAWYDWVRGITKEPPSTLCR